MYHPEQPPEQPRTPIDHEEHLQILRKEALSPEGQVALSVVSATIATQHETIVKAEKRAEQAEKRAEQADAKASEASVRACTDKLTGLPNWRGFDEAQGRWGAMLGGDRNQRFEDKKVPKLGLLQILDLDYFKLVNDVLEWDQGDRSLRIVAYVLQKSVRRGDEVYRLGGDEFALLAPIRPQHRDQAPVSIQNRYDNLMDDLRHKGGNSIYVPPGMRWTDLDTEAVQVLEASWGHGILELGDGPDQIAEKCKAVMARMKAAKEVKSLR